MAPALVLADLESTFRKLFVERHFELCNTPVQNEIFRGATPSVTPCASAGCGRRARSCTRGVTIRELAASAPPGRRSAAGSVRCKGAGSRRIFPILRIPPQWRRCRTTGRSSFSGCRPCSQNWSLSGRFWRFS